MAQNDSAHASGEADEQLKKRARRRLVGAIALVLFAAIVLPMVMDHQPRPTNPEIQVRIPSQDAPAFEGRLPGQAAHAAKPGAKPLHPEQKSSATESTLAATSSQQADTDKSVADKPSVSSIPETRPAEPKPLESKPVEPKGGITSESKPEPKAVAKAEAKAALLPVAADGEQWVVQLGAYQEPGRVKLLTAKLKELGMPVFTEKVDTPQGSRTRVRAGPFPNKEAALKAQERVKIIGVTGPVAPK